MAAEVRPGKLVTPVFVNVRTCRYFGQTGGQYTYGSKCVLWRQERGARTDEAGDAHMNEPDDFDLLREFAQRIDGTVFKRRKLFRLQAQERNLLAARAPAPR